MRKATLVLFLAVAVGFAATADVYLMPARPGAKSQIVKATDAVRTTLPIPRNVNSKTVDMWIVNTDGGDSNYVLVGVDYVDTFGVWFEPPAACSLLAVEFTNMSYSDPTLTEYYGFISTVDNSGAVDYAHDFPEYHTDTIPGPSGWITGFLATDTFHVKYADTLWNMDTLYLAAPYNDSLDIFFAGWSKATPDSSPNPYIYANGNAPYHTLMYRPPAGGGTVGWYSSWHAVRVRALVRMYENPPPVLVDWDKLPDSYNTGVRTATAHWTDFGVPPESSGVAVAGLVYDVNGGTPDTLISTTPISGDSTDGVWSFDIPGVAVGDTVTYYVYATDLQGKTTTNAITHSYIIRAGTTGNFLFVIGGDELYGFFYDPISTLYPGQFDLWDAYYYGDPDQSVVDFYNTGGGLNVIVWVSWGGDGFAKDTTYIKSFLDNGGNLWIAGQDFLHGITGTYDEWIAPAGTFIRDYLKMKGGYDDFMTDSMFIQYGLPGDTITNNFATTPVYVAPYWSLASGYDWAGKIDSLDTGAVADFFYETGEIGGYWYEDATTGYRVVFQYWPWNYICPSTDAAGIDTVSQDTLTINILTGLFGVPSGVEESGRDVPNIFFISQNSPNPVRNGTTIRFSIPARSKVELKVYDVAGRTVSTLINGEMKAGIHTVRWNGTTDTGTRVANGVYFYRLKAGKNTATRKMVVLK